MKNYLKLQELISFLILPAQKVHSSLQLCKIEIEKNVWDGIWTDEQEFAKSYAIDYGYRAF